MLCITGKIPPGQVGGALLGSASMVVVPVKGIIWGLCSFSSPPFSLSSPNSFHGICMHITVLSQELAVRLWRASNIVCLCKEMVRLCACAQMSVATCHVCAAAACSEVDLSHPSVFHRGSWISTLFSERNHSQLKSSQGLPGFLLLILKNESKPGEEIVFGPILFKGLEQKSWEENRWDIFINQKLRVH